MNFKPSSEQRASLARELAVACRGYFGERAFTSRMAFEAAAMDAPIAAVVQKALRIAGYDATKRQMPSRPLTVLLTNAAGRVFDNMRLVREDRIDSEGEPRPWFRFVQITPDMRTTDSNGTHQDAPPQSPAEVVRVLQSSADVVQAIERLGTRLLDYFEQVWGGGKKP